MQFAGAATKARGWGCLSTPQKAVGALVAGLAAAALLVLLRMPPFTDRPVYFNFADRRTILALPYFADVVSNVPFAVIGILGLLGVLRGFGQGAAGGGDRWDRLAYATFFGGVLLTAAGSAYFHRVPSPATLVWDRLPMAIAFMSLFAIAISDRICARLGRALLVPLLAAGIGSVLYWRWTEQAGQGDVRFYLLVQFLPVLAFPILTLLPGRHTRRGDLAIVTALYALAKLFESFDAAVFHWTGWISGHSLKHLAGALAAAWVLRMAGPFLGRGRT